jgi:hypothetical protein
VIPNATTPEAEAAANLNGFYRRQMYKYGKQSSFDPTSQTEDVGDNSMKASTYGLKI